MAGEARDLRRSSRTHSVDWRSTHHVQAITVPADSRAPGRGPRAMKSVEIQTKAWPIVAHKSRHRSRAFRNSPKSGQRGPAFHVKTRRIHRRRREGQSHAVYVSQPKTVADLIDKAGKDLDKIGFSAEAPAETFVLPVSAVLLCDTAEPPKASAMAQTTLSSFIRRFFTTRRMRPRGIRWFSGNCRLPLTPA